MSKRRNPEQLLQISVAQYLRVALRPPTIWSAFPAGGGGKIRGAFLKAMGLAQGWPDLLVMHPAAPGCGPVVVGIELKAAKGRQTPEQKAVSESFFACRAWYVLCRSLDEVEAALRYCKVPLHATTTREAA